MTIRVLVVEDEEVAAAAHAEYVGRVPGFTVAGVARSGADAVRLLREDPEVDLVLLDMHLPDVHGLELLQRFRQDGLLCDVIAVTSARDLEVVRRAVSQGVVQYAAYRDQLVAADDEVVQSEVDELLGKLRPAGGPALPKGMSAETMRLVTERLRSAPSSATEVADATGTSRVTARRYLEHLADTGVVARRSRYGGGGRPEVEYRWLRRDDRH
jgi:response regulator of citrate/malate metabolism